MAAPPGAAQQDAADSGDRDRPGLCFRPEPLPTCRMAPVLEMQAGAVFVQGHRTRVRPGGGRLTESLGLDREVAWRVGALVNVTPAWGVGVTADLSTWRREQPLAGMDLRVRRWFGRDWAVDGELRLARHDEGLLFQQQDAPTLGLGLRGTWKDLVGIWVRADILDAPAAEVDVGDRIVRVDADRKHILVGGVSLGREAGILATLVYVGGLFIFLARHTS